MIEQWTVLTYKKFSFKNDDGDLIEGVTLHCWRENSENGWPGVEYAKFSISKSSPVYASYAPSCSEVINVGFNRYGKVASIEKVG